MTNTTCLLDINTDNVISLFLGLFTVYILMKYITINNIVIVKGKKIDAYAIDKCKAILNDKTKLINGKCNIVRFAHIE
jgi:hypothetical protein